ncbi:creatininase family protein [Lachnospiraceae bacterium 62-35]
MEYKLKNVSWTEFEERAKTSRTILVPTGACEVYGPHLPLGSDIIAAEKICELVAVYTNLCFQYSRDRLSLRTRWRSRHLHFTVSGTRTGTYGKGGQHNSKKGAVAGCYKRVSV